MEMVIRGLDADKELVLALSSVAPSAGRQRFPDVG